MGKTYFAVSDVHSFYEPLHKALFKAGFRKTNPNHIIILVGDAFDRGPDSVKVYQFLRSIPKKRRILIRGNHEYLLRDLINRGLFYENDYYNGTLGTVIQFTGDTFNDCVYTPKEVCERFKNNGVLQWILSDEWVNYAEIGNYIFTHCWIPVNILDGTDIYNMSLMTSVEMRSDWREASDKDWEDSTWGCPWVMAKKGLVPDGYTIVCGHWHSYDFPVRLDENNKDYPNYNIYKGHGCIALDACTVRSGQCNVLVLTEEEMKSTKGNN